jgi:hypothetical protein
MVYSNFSYKIVYFSIETSVADPDPPGSASGSGSHKYGSGSVTFHHQAKIVGKTWISAVL